jgi:hypothetical protein
MAMRSAHLIAIATSLTVGCIGFDLHYSVRDLEQGKTVSLGRPCKSSEFLLDDEPSAKRFSTLAGDKDMSFQIRVFAYNGSLQETISVPCFSPEYAHVYPFQEGYAFSVPAQRVVYYDSPSRELRVFDWRSKTTHVILTNAAPDRHAVPVLLWRCLNQIMLGVDDYASGRDDDPARLLLLDADTGAVRFAIKSTTIDRLRMAISPTRRYLAYWEGNDRRNLVFGKIRVYDMETKQEYAVIDQGDRVLLHRPFWDNDDASFVFAQGNRIMQFSMATRSLGCLKAVANVDYISVRGFAGGKVFYDVHPARWQDEHRRQYTRLYVQDLQSQVATAYDGLDVGGEIKVIDDGRKVITGRGFVVF